MKSISTFFASLILVLVFTACGGSGGGSDEQGSINIAASTIPTEQLLPAPTEEETPTPVEEETPTPVEEETPTPAQGGSPNPSQIDPISGIIHPQLGSSKVSQKEGIWANQPLKSSMWSEHVQLTAGVHEYYVSPAGNDGTAGTRTSPWSLDYALHRYNTLPGNSIIWLMEGDYVHPDSTSTYIATFKTNLQGKLGQPIHLRPEYGAQVRIDGGLEVQAEFCKYLRIWDIEMTTIGKDWRPNDRFINIDAALDINPFWEELRRITVANGSHFRGQMTINGGEDIKVINTIMHKLTYGIGFWKSASNSELYGALIYDNGFTDYYGNINNKRGSGPGIYMQNTTNTTRVVSDNIVAGNHSTGMQIRTGENTSDFSITGNVFFAPTTGSYGRNYLHIAEYQSKNISFKNNFVHSYLVKMPYVYSNDEYQGKKADHSCSGNNFFNIDDLKPAYTCNDDVQGNTNHIGANYSSAVIRPNKYDPRRANLMVFNGERKADISIDLSLFLENGESFAVLNSLDPVGAPLVTGTYNGSYVNIHWPSLPWTIPGGDATIDKEFWAFVIVKQ